jgi:hypothetical protein
MNPNAPVFVMPAQTDPTADWLDVSRTREREQAHVGAPSQRRTKRSEREALFAPLVELPACS